MKRTSKDAKRWFGTLLGCALAMPLVATAGQIGAELQTKAAVGTAANGNTGSVAISVLVTKSNGLPAHSMGDDGAALPAGWSLVSDFNLPAGACAMEVTSFENHDNGVYTIEVSPDSTGAPCNWVTGEYHYAVQINRAFRKVGRYRGSVLGAVAVP